MNRFSKRVLSLFVITAALAPNLMAEEKKLGLTLRSRSKEAPKKAVETKAEWKAGKTALVICDMWDDHWCESAARRVGELAGPMNKICLLYTSPSPRD